MAAADYNKNTMANALDLKPGNFFQMDGDIYTVLSAVHTHQQQRRGVVRIKARQMRSGKTVEFVWRSDERVEDVVIEETALTFLYRDTAGFHFMDEATYEQVTFPEEVVGDAVRYLKENLSVTGLMYGGRPIGIRVPFFVDLKVVEAEPGFKGDTVQGGRKRAVLETGLAVQVPLFIQKGDTVRIDTRTDEYLTRTASNET